MFYSSEMEIPMVLRCSAVVARSSSCLFMTNDLFTSQPNTHAHAAPNMLCYSTYKTNRVRVIEAATVRSYCINSFLNSIGYTVDKYNVICNITLWTVDCRCLLGVLFTQITVWTVLCEPEVSFPVGVLFSNFNPAWLQQISLYLHL
jgi:hypothetical protein